MTLQTILQWSSGPVIILAITLFLGTWPKDKAMETGSKLGLKIGGLLSLWGNKKLGKKIWSKIEEGPIVTGFAFIISFINSLEVKMTADNCRDDSQDDQSQIGCLDSDPGDSDQPTAG